MLTQTNAIVLGNLVSSRFVETLYWEWYALTDLWYPGRGGYEVRTLHDLYGTGKNVLLLGGSDELAYVGLADGGTFERGSLKVSCEAFCVSPESLSFVNAERVELPGVQLEAVPPCNVELDLVSARGVAQSEREDAGGITVNGTEYGFVNGTVRFSLGTPDEAFPEALAEWIQSEALAGAESSAPQSGETPLPSIPTDWTFDAGAEVLGLHAGDVDGDGTAEILCATGSGCVEALDGAGEQVWARQMPHEVTALTALPDGLLVACGDQSVYQSDLGGEPCARFALRGLPLWHFACTGNRPMIADSAGHVVALNPGRR